MTCVPFIFYKMLREMTFLLEIFSFTSVEIKNISKIFLLKAIKVLLISIGLPLKSVKNNSEGAHLEN